MTEQTPTPQEQEQVQADTQAQPQQSKQELKKFTPELCVSTINKLPKQLEPLRNCFAQPFDAFRKAFKDPKEADRVMAKEIDFAAQAMLANNFLIKCATSNPLSLTNALKNVALTNSTLNPVLKQGYLVPFAGAITFMPSYMGLVDVLINNGLVRKIEAHPVFEDEKFEIKFGTNSYIKHIPNPWGKREKENLKGCYYYVVMTDGTELYDTMSTEEIEKIRKRAPSAKSTSPWDTDYIEMCRKTAIRRAFKMIPKKGISEDKVKALEAVFDYDEKVENAWIDTQKQNKQPTNSADNFDDDGFVDYSEVY